LCPRRKTTPKVHPIRRVNTMSALSAKRVLPGFLLGILGAVANVVSAGVLEDYQQAHRNLKEGKRPCETIPYSDLRDQCLRNSEIVNNNCKIVQWSCEGESREFHDTKGLLNDRRARLARIEELTKENGKQNDKLRESKDQNEIGNLKKVIETNERETLELKRAVDTSEREIAVRREKIQKRIEWAKRCIDNREDVQKVFESTISKARSESDDRIRSMRDELLNKWEPSVKEHNQPKDDIKNGIRKCEEMRDQRD
jgi:hypothetical protein